MMKVKSIEKYNTAFGKSFIVETSELLKVGEKIEIDGIIYEIKKLAFPTRPTKKEAVAVYV